MESGGRPWAIQRAFAGARTIWSRREENIAVDVCRRSREALMGMKDATREPEHKRRRRCRHTLYIQLCASQR